ncbi:MAG: rhodanese-like domain-containing protein [Arcobacter sp.]|jgi:rhodanese-related sulfurtransferase|uniref:rhodanese-like domain-containing protein n=1 Tax=Arcobacter sp. TaxID=1872629 RepID=UPI00258A3BC0|nr:rhodanese-like domain-containing protein [Arcobacter sp.]MDD3008674.1 rhodanese-like domain-containing protein [Arcobacter sp.]MDY3203541.1 rhodanese-like domain-containing protein [Arcobacter sp.]
MKRVLKNSVLISFLLFNGIAYSQELQSLNKPTEAVYELIKKYNLEEVDFDYVKNAIGNGNRNSVSSILIDARPEIKYQRGTIPSSLNIPDTNFEEYYNVLKDVPKDKELIVYCGGYNCTKSPTVAKLLRDKGHKNVKVYSAGEPEWAKKSYLEIDTSVVKVYQENNSAFIVDARPYVKFLQETIPGAISIPDTELDKLIGKFPINKNEKIVIFCGGFSCEKSHIIANKLISLDYKDVTVYAGGLPAWKESGLGTTVNAKVKKEEKTEKKEQFSKNGMKLGVDEGSVDGEWLKKLILEDKVPEFIQIVDVTAPNEFKNGHIKGAINIEAAKLTAEELISKLPKGKTIIFNCTAGGRSIEAWAKLKAKKFDISEIYYLDANISCKGNDCKIDVNEPLE